ncbi:Cell wall integrity and stress response component 1 [Paragonimus skrjabini miyazakii]|uniref:Cell wall integrity and stress response component 1 n=1 Tax=Paragonimus skrjabini miyazakii TaxID=59628 RepID=A0A8S9ZC54_9TREM|nr:Cell wall integrity and stress response component 1 [Paragonimus skrjabini miyazakii]
MWCCTSERRKLNDRLDQFTSGHPTARTYSGIDNTTQSGLLIIGAGLMRTGTTSLKNALEVLLGQPCYHMSEIVTRYEEPHIKQWLLNFQKMEKTVRNDDRILWDNIFYGCASAVDYPTCAFYKELMDVYPHAKVILTEREPRAWVDSCRSTTLCPDMLRTPTIGMRLSFWFRNLKSLPILHHTMFAHTLGENYGSMSDKTLIETFERWNKTVQNYVHPERLLIYRVEQGWRPLCKFLKIPEPPVDKPFPHLNKREEMAKNICVLFDSGRLIDRVFLYLLVFIPLFLVFYTYISNYWAS